MFQLGGKGNITRIKPELWAAMSNKVSGLNVSSSFPIQPIMAKGNGHLTSQLLSIFIGGSTVWKTPHNHEAGQEAGQENGNVSATADGLSSRG